MNTEIMIRELKRVEEAHKNDKVFTGNLDIAAMAHDVRKRLQFFKPYEDTGLTPDEINALRDINSFVERKFDGTLTLKRIVDAFCEFYDANSAGERVAKARLLTNGSVDKWEELNERDTAAAIVVDDMTGGMKLYSCPICDTPVHEKDNFCPECGQRLKWED